MKHTYCTAEQTKLAFVIGAPLEKFDPEHTNGVICKDGKPYAIPTTQQLITWFREEKNIDCGAFRTPTNKFASFAYCNDINYLNSDNWHYIISYDMHDSYNEAELNAISKTLKFLKTKLIREQLCAIAKPRSKEFIEKANKRKEERNLKNEINI